MGASPKTLVWFRRDFRLSDHPALCAAVRRGAVVPVFILEPSATGLGAAPRLRLEHALAAFDRQLKERGSKLILRRGHAHEVVVDLIRETGADAVYWSRRYDRAGVAVDTELKARLKEAGIAAKSFGGTLLFEPWTVETGQGGPYRVYTPFWKAVRQVQVPAPLPEPDLASPDDLPASDNLEDWQLATDMRRGRKVVEAHFQAGEGAAQDRLARFLRDRVAGYKAERDFLDRAATSELSDALSLGEISPATCWHGAVARMQQGAAGAEHFLKELVWREFAWHLMWHFPTLDQDNWRPEWNGFHWNEDSQDPAFLAWRQGRTGVELVDAAMRELYVTGKMHNRARMITASYLTKHLRMHWRLGLKWFEDCLIDWDAASNAMGWQWVAGSGPDAAPYFRIYNPDTQADKFDPDHSYRNRWLAEASADAMSFFDAVPKQWKLTQRHPPYAPIVGLKEGRAAALAAYESFKSQ